MKIVIIIMAIILNISGFQIQNNRVKLFPKPSYTKIHDISYKAPIYIRRNRPFAFQLIKDISYIISNYVNDSHAITSESLYYIFSTQFNKTLFN